MNNADDCAVRLWNLATNPVFPREFGSSMLSLLHEVLDIDVDEQLNILDEEDK